MRRIRYQVACSLDGFIAGPNGEYDWIVPDSEIDFDALFAEFDTLVMGRKTWEIAEGMTSGKKVVVFSRTMKPADHPGITVLPEATREAIEELRAGDGRDLWLFGGGELFRTFLELGCVDTVEPAIIPILLGGGIPMLPTPAVRRRLELEDHRHYPKSGIMLLKYRVLEDEKHAKSGKAKRAKRTKNAKNAKKG